MGVPAQFGAGPQKHTGCKVGVHESTPEMQCWLRQRDHGHALVLSAQTWQGRRLCGHCGSEVHVPLLPPPAPVPLGHELTPLVHCP